MVKLHLCIFLAADQQKEQPPVHASAGYNDHRLSPVQVTAVRINILNVEIHVVGAVCMILIFFANF